MNRLMLCALAGALLFAAACGSDDKDDDTTDGFSQTPLASTTAPATGATAAPTADDGVCGAAAPGGRMGKYTEPPAMTIDQDKKYFATIKMDIGDIKFELFAKDAPCHVNSFVFLANEGFYDGVTFHRVLPGFVAQTGDPTGTGSGGPGYTIQLEVNKNKHIDGAVGMARSQDPDSAGSQFFIDYGPQPALDSGYTVFGQVVEGRDVLDKITPRDPGKPADQTIVGTKVNTIEIAEE